MQLPTATATRLYDPRFEHDACGVGFIARIDGRAGHQLLELALQALCNLEHRGALADDARTGDGAGVLTQLPRAILQRELAARGIAAAREDLGLGMFFLPRDTQQSSAATALVTQAAADHNVPVAAWREVPVVEEALGARALQGLPSIRQAIFIRPAGMDERSFERTLYLARKQMEAGFQAAGIAAYIPSLSARTVVYKGLMLGSHLADFYLDLRDPAYETALVVYHQRYSTNTFPTWERAQPFRMLAHNGEINTLQGNVNWMRSREQAIELPADFRAAGPPPMRDLLPVIDESGSDSAMLDNTLELLTQAGRDVRHALAMLVPEAWEKVADMEANLRAFYQYHSCLTEPWDGPAALAFSDGRIVGTALDRNGLRPARYVVTDDGLVVSGSEVGVVPIDEARILHKGKLGPGQMLAVDVINGQLLTDHEIKQFLATRRPYRTWLQQHLQRLPTPLGAAGEAAEIGDLAAMQAAFGYTSEDLQVVLRPMASSGAEPVGSMGDDTPLAGFSQLEFGRPLFHFIKQRFAEVTNPPIDPLREEQVMSISVGIGRRRSILTETPEHAHLLQLNSPVLSDAQLAAIRAAGNERLRTRTVSVLVAVDALHEAGFAAALERIGSAAAEAVEAGAAIVILSDRGVNARTAALPILLAAGAVHHALIRCGLRSRVSLLVETGEAREVHHIAALVGYGAEAINPYLALASVRHLALDRDQKQRGERAAPQQSDAARAQTLADEAERQLIKALEKGLLKIMSKMGISSLDSYCGAQTFEAVGLDQVLVERYLRGTPNRIGGIGLARLAQDAQARHQRAFGAAATVLPHPGLYKFKKDGEYHAFSPAVVHALQRAVQSPHALNGDSHGPPSVEGYANYRAYAELVQQRPATEPRDLLEFVAAGPAVPLSEVEPIEAIVRRFSTAAMSHGSTSSEAHETLSIAMNRLGGLANSGEGGEAPERYTNERNSRIKQVASGRFGVTPAYLTSAAELQIKMAQGAKPGEGGQLPGHKVNDEIARIRHTVAGVALISPPPHHDIYSIEDLAQLIHDLKEVNPLARISVKLVATAGVGTIAAGVAKGYADTVLISGHAGGTGASPLSSIKHAGIPWEIGLAEAQQTLVLNGLRGRVRLRADGGFKTGRDVVTAALLGADEYSFGTAALVAEGCIMARACHNNTCPVGIATQRAELRARFPGKPEMVMAFFRYIAQEVRELLAALGLRSLDEAVGRTDLLRQRAAGPDGIDLTAVLGAATLPTGAERRHSGGRNDAPSRGSTLNERIVSAAQPALAARGPISLNFTVHNRDRSVGARLAGAIGQLYGDRGLPAGTIRLNLQGSAGQSLGAFNAAGVEIRLIGEANDYVGKGMAGGLISLTPPAAARFVWHENVIAGNTLLYGATGGELYAAGQVGERFAVRNSGATAVVEGIGDHGCEYMTGGVVAVLGPTGRNFGAGMTGGIAYVLDELGNFGSRLNPQLVELRGLSGHDEARLVQLIRRHVELTGSPLGQMILAGWPNYRQRFVAVVPRDSVARIEASAEGTAQEAVSGARAA